MHMLTLYVAIVVEEIKLLVCGGGGEAGREGRVAVGKTLQMVRGNLLQGEL